MNKQNFLNIIQSHVFAGNDDVLSFQKLAKQYPYSQIIHTLIAKQQTEVKSNSVRSAIQLAAIYSTDRVVLKRIVESAVLQETQAADTSVVEDSEHIESKTFINISSGVSDIAQLRSDIFEHLALLQESKKPFRTELNDLKTKKAKNTSVIKTKPVKKERSSGKAKNQPEKKTTSTSKKTKKEAISLSQKEQVDLIEKFIKSTPKITKVSQTPASNENQQDLSKIDATFEEDFASENLAQILSKQGNKEKAIEIYKKLIWKFPQKKAYFATQIKELKK